MPLRDPKFLIIVPTDGIATNHDDIIKWKHFSATLACVRGIHRSSVNFPHKGQWRGALMFPLVCAWINGCGNSRGTGDLRYPRAHYVVTVMWCWAISTHHEDYRVTHVSMNIASMSVFLNNHFWPDVQIKIVNELLWNLVTLWVLKHIPLIWHCTLFWLTWVSNKNSFIPIPILADVI